VVTRWNSTFYSIERAIQQKTALIHVAVDYDRCAELKELDFEMLDKIRHVLSPFEKITKQMSRREESISAVLPAFYSLMHTLRPNDFFGPADINDELHEKMVSQFNTIEQFKSKILSGLEDRMRPFLKERYNYFVLKLCLLFLFSYLIAATVIDPRFRLSCFSEHDREFTKSLTISKFKNMNGNGSPTSPPIIERRILDSEDPIASFMQINEPIFEIFDTSISQSLTEKVSDITK